MSVFPYVYYKESELEVLSNNISGRLLTWSRDWFHKEGAVELVSIIPFDINDYVYGKQSMLIHVTISEGKWVDCLLKTKDISHIAGILLGLDEPPGNFGNRHNEPGKMGTSLVLKAIQSLVVAICGDDVANAGETIKTEIIDHHYVATKNTAIGKLKMTMSIASGNVDLMVSPLLSHELVGRKYHRINGTSFYEGQLEKLFLQKKVPYEVALGTVDITIEELNSLQVGDVLKLDKKLTESCGIEFDKNRKNYKCTLGRVNGSKAIRIEG